MIRKQDPGKTDGATTGMIPPKESPMLLEKNIKYRQVFVKPSPLAVDDAVPLKDGDQGQYFRGSAAANGGVVFQTAHFVQQIKVSGSHPAHTQAGKTEGFGKTGQ